MKPKTRLLIRFTLPNGDQKGWGYDAYFYKTAMQLQQSIIDDFAEWPEHTAVHMFYHEAEIEITPTDNYDLAEQAANWLAQNGTSL